MGRERKEKKAPKRASTEELQESRSEVEEQGKEPMRVVPPLVAEASSEEQEAEMEEETILAPASQRQRAGTGSRTEGPTSMDMLCKIMQQMQEERQADRQFMQKLHEERQTD